MELQKEWMDKAEKEKGITKGKMPQEMFRSIDGISKASYLQGVTEMLIAVKSKAIMPNESELEQMADNYISQFLPHINTTGHWIGYQEGYKKAIFDILHELKSIKPNV
jgi:hypothetical protein